jgi:chromosome partitioning protein
MIMKKQRDRGGDSTDAPRHDNDVHAYKHADVTSLRRSQVSVLTIASSKGGPGKTTVAMLLAGSLAEERLRVVALDADPTQAFARWAANTYEGSTFESHAEADETRLAHLIDATASNADVVIVDTAGFGNRAAAVAMTSADAVLVPALSGEADVTEAEKTIRLAEGLARAARREIPTAILLNRVRRTQLARHAAHEIETAGLPRLEASLSDLVAYGELSYSGRIPTTGTAAAEIAALIAELRARGWLPQATARRQEPVVHRRHEAS